VKVCCLSVDLDEIHHYFAIHATAGSAEGASTAVYDVALERFLDWSRRAQVPLTLFAVAEDLQRAEVVRGLRRAEAAGHEVGNHTLNHRYDLVRLSREEQVRQVREATRCFERHLSQPVVGFRAPGYTMTEAVYEVLQDEGLEYSSSVFPCPYYYAAKAAVVGLLRLRGKVSRSILDHPRVLTAPAAPYRIGERYTERGAGVLELPIGVTPWLRLPVIGTSLMAAGPRWAKRLCASLARRDLVNLEFHGIDLLDRTDGLEALATRQRDLFVPLERKLSTLNAVVEQLRSQGVEFTTLRDAARRMSA